MLQTSTADHVMTGSELFMIWLIAGAILILLEFIIPGGIVFFLGLGAMLVALLLYAGLINGWLPALTTWFIGSLALLFGLRGVVQKIIPATVEHGNTDEDLDAYNKTATVSETIPVEGAGRIHFRGSTWAAKNYHSDRDLLAGETVRIIFREDLLWVVEGSSDQSKHT